MEDTYRNWSRSAEEENSSRKKTTWRRSIVVKYLLPSSPGYPRFDPSGLRQGVPAKLPLQVGDDMIVILEVKKSCSWGSCYGP